MHSVAKVTTIVDTSPPEAIIAAINTVNRTKGLRMKPGIEALWALHKAEGHSLPRHVMEQNFGALDLHFGWFCRRVAESLGASHPDVFALVDYSKGTDGSQILTLKASVVAALSTAAMKRGKTAK